MVKVTALTAEDVDACPIRQVLTQVTGKWQMLIVLTLEDGPMRFGALRRAIGDVTQRVLTENLRKLERDGYLSRSVDPGPPVAVTYALTDLGAELAEKLAIFCTWANARYDVVIQNRAQYQAA